MGNILKMGNTKNGKYQKVESTEKIGNGKKMENTKKWEIPKKEEKGITIKWEIKKLVQMKADAISLLDKSG